MDYSEGGFQEGTSRHEYTGVKSIRALTAKQLSNLSIDNPSSTSIYILDNVELTNVSMVGYVVNVRSTSSGIFFEISDTTGTVECLYWLTANSDEASVARINSGALLHITGSLKVHNSKKSLNVASVRQMPSDYLVYHLTSALYQSLFYQHRIEHPKPEFPTIGGAVHPMTEQKGGMPSINTDILQTYRNNQDENGLELDLVISMLRSKYSESEIREAIENLLVGCHLYSVDGTHYKTTL